VAVNLGWKNTPVGDYLSDRFQCPTCVLNDVDAGVFGEYRFGAAKNARCTIGLFPGTGIGGGCVYEGKIFRGRVLSCMEVGHIRISSSPRSSGIDMSGTLESEASRLAIAAECAKLAYRGEAPYLMEHFGADLTRIRSSAIAEAIDHGDKNVERVVREACQQIGYGVVNLIHLMAPDCIVLGGGLVEALPKLVPDEIARTVKKNVLGCYQDQYTIEIAKLGDDAGSMGAAAWVAQCHATS
jgi:glucokinase